PVAAADIAVGDLPDMKCDADRVDFTAIGRDLNVLARVERLCKTYNTPLIATDIFIDGLAHALEPLGTVALRGFQSVTP
ncbi:hypothetical protein, partial [Klebsiella pneumoniae]|uniref:hypothetical protein n=1 Tax=Klebsiella pneumoniae TaxID=573 RepID=UPI00376F0608